MRLKFTDAEGKVLVINLDYLASTYGLEAPVKAETMWKERKK